MLAPIKDSHKYRGGPDFSRDYFSKMKPDDEKKATEKARETVQRGWGAGPFTTPPFPNEKCPKQAISTKSFTIPKHKWIKDGAKFTDTEARHKDTLPIGSIQILLLGSISIHGSRSREGMLPHAYKQLQVADEDQQVFVADGQFWIDFCACFGSLYGNDIYSTFGNAHCICLALAAAVPLESTCTRTEHREGGTEGGN